MTLSGIRLATRLFSDETQAKEFRARLEVTYHCLINAHKKSCKGRVASMASQNGHSSILSPSIQGIWTTDAPEPKH